MVNTSKKTAITGKSTSKKTAITGKSTTKKTATSVTPLTVAQQQMVEIYTPVAMKVGASFAKEGKKKGVDVKDLQQEACLGLCIAAQRYTDMGHDFMTYAYYWCRKMIEAFINNEPLPDDFCEVENAKADHYADDEAENNPVIKVDKLLALLEPKEKQVVCLIYGITPKGETTPLSIKEIAKKLKLSTCRIRQIYDEAMSKL